jgi:D-arabinose 1-dehydrogenase-like Zn-dependent alcohol dehydrogenase
VKALVFDTPSQEPSLAVRDVDTPVPGPNDALVEVAACGLCHHDIAVMGGVLRRGVTPGVTLGHEISGRVAGIGGSVTTVGVGDRVTSTLTTFCGRCDRCLQGREYRCPKGRGIGHAVNGGFAEFVALPESSLVPVPDEIDLEEACILACPLGVALQGLRDVALLKPGETVLVVGAGGGLGVHSFIMAAALGARAIAVTTSPHKVESLEALQAGDVVLAGELDFSELALALTEDRGADVVVNPVGSAVFESSVRSLSQFGRMLLLGEIEGGKASVRLPEILFRDAAVLSSTGAGRRHIADVAAMVASGAVKPVISQRFRLEDAAEAYRLMRDRKTFGRVVLVP